MGPGRCGNLWVGGVVKEGMRRASSERGHDHVRGRRCLPCPRRFLPYPASLSPCIRGFLCTAGCGCTPRSLRVPGARGEICGGHAGSHHGTAHGYGRPRQARCDCWREVPLMFSARVHVHGRWGAGMPDFCIPVSRCRSPHPVRLHPASISQVYAGGCARITRHAVQCQRQTLCWSRTVHC